VGENLSTQVRNYAVYLPALSREYCKYVIKYSDANAPAPLKPRHLNFLSPSSPLWHYKWCLASAGRFAFCDESNAITRRNPRTTVVIGDSGGYQVGSGALKKIKDWSVHRTKPEHIVKL
jgi:hypothetical protein